MKAIKYAILVLLGIFQISMVNHTGATFNFRQIDNEAFTYGEELKFRVHYGFINAATINIKVGDKPEKIDGRTTYNIKASGRTNKSFDWMYTVRDHFETNLDSQSMAPLKYFKSVREDNYKDVDMVYYYHDKKKILGKKKNMTMPDSYVQDLVSAVFYARSLDLGKAYVGKTFPINVYLDQKIYQLKFKYMGTETIKSDIGKIKCYKLRPQLVVDRVFKDEDDMTVWVSADANKVPVRIQTDIWVGALKVDLVSHKGLRNKITAKVK
jgi:hypothetical protein